MSTRIIYDGMDLQNAEYEKTNEIEKAQNDSIAAGIAFVTAERDYAITRKNIRVALMAQGYSTSAADKRADESDEVIEAKYQMGVAKVLYEGAKERINITKLEIRVLENQISREFGNKYGGGL